MRGGAHPRRTRLHESAGLVGGITKQAGRIELPRALAPSQQARDLIDFHQPVHTLAHAELIAMLLGAKVAIASDSESAKRFATELAGPGIHYQPNYMGKDLGITRIKGDSSKILTKVK